MPYTRIRRQRKGAAFFAGVLLFVFVACLFVGIFTCAGRTEHAVSLGYDFYFLIKECESTTAGVIAGGVADSGGAGYLYGDDVVLSVYFTESDACSVRDRLDERGVETRIKEVSCKEFMLRGDASKRDLAISNGKTVYAIGKELYEIANRLERAECTQEEARKALNGAVAALKGLQRENENADGALFSRWNAVLFSAARKGEEIATQIIFCKDVRYLEVQLFAALVDMGEYY